VPLLLLLGVNSAAAALSAVHGLLSIQRPQEVTRMDRRICIHVAPLEPDVSDICILTSY